MAKWTDIGEITATWKKDEYGWQIAPSNLTWIKAGARVRVGEGARIDEGAIIAKETRIGERAYIGPRACNPVDIGSADGSRKCIAEVDGVAYIGADCWWFTLDDALEHWGNHPEDRTMTLALLESAKAIANLKGWKWSGLVLKNDA
jgi:hypothetical protein